MHFYVVLLHTRLSISSHTLCNKGKPLAAKCKRIHKPLCPDMPPSKALKFSKSQIFPLWYPKKHADTQKHPEARQQQKRRRMKQVCIMQVSLSRNNNKNSIINSKLLITGHALWISLSTNLKLNTSIFSYKVKCQKATCKFWLELTWIISL